MKVEHFRKVIPEQVSELISFFSKRNLGLTVVGGIPRDFLLTGELGKDWDIEVSSQTHAFSISFWKDLAKELRSMGEVTNLSYQVIRLKIQDYEFEFSPPRLEIFKESEDHKNFEAEFDFKLPPEDSWKRRDFTINAIGFKLSSDGVDVIDPFEGQKMLNQRILHPCSEQFVRDPVRYLRAYRFSVRLNFDFSSTLKNYLKNMPQQFSSHYLSSEMKKSKSPLKFYQRLLKAGCIGLPLKDETLHSGAFSQSLVDENNLYSWVMSLEYFEIDAKVFVDYFGLSIPLYKKLLSFSEISREIIHLDVEFLKQDFDIVKESRQLHCVFSWYFSALQLQSKPLTHFIKDFIKLHSKEWFYLLSFEPLKDVKHIEPSFRSKYIVWNLCQRI